ncbi:MAG: helix-turn-helix domain-containing protein [Candidatus Diapherotrites archaeon]
MDECAKIIFDAYRHFFPDLKFSEAQVYCCLLDEVKKTSERIIAETTLSRATVFSSLKSLMQKGLVAKSDFFPVSYFVINPKKVFSSNFLKLISKLKSYKKKLFVYYKSQPEISEFILLESNGTKIILNKHSKKELKDIKKISELRLALDNTIRKIKENRAKN